MKESEGKTEAQPDKKLETLNAEIAKDQEMIRAADNKAGLLGGLLATIITLIGLLTAVLDGQIGNADITAWVIVTGLLGIVALTGALVGLAMVMWPRTRTVPIDKDASEYRIRIEQTAAKIGPDHNDYLRGYYLAHIARVKHKGVKIVLVSLVILVAMTGSIVLLLVI